MTAAEKRMWVVDALLLALLFAVFAGARFSERTFTADAEARAASVNAQLRAERERAERNAVALAERAAERERVVGDMSDAGLVFEKAGPNAKAKGRLHGVVFYEEETLARSAFPVDGFLSAVSGHGARVAEADVFIKSVAAKGLDGIVASWHPSAARALRSEGRSAEGFFRGGGGNVGDAGVSAGTTDGAFFVSSLFAGEESR